MKLKKTLSMSSGNTLAIIGTVHSMTTKDNSFKHLVELLNKKSFGDNNDRKDKRKNKRPNRKN